MKQLVSVNLTTRTAKDWQPPELTFGESLTLALRFYKNSAGSEIEASLIINSLKASIGAADARPRGGAFSIKIGGGSATDLNTTAALDCKVAASDLANALTSVAAHSTYGAPRAVFCDDSWLLFFGDQTQQVPMTVVRNGLWPLSYGRITAWQVDGKWVHELRLTQAPVAFTSSHDVVLPPAPEITRIREGGADALFSWNEIQALYVPPEFRGAYVIKRGFGQTKLLSREDGVDAIEEALQALGAGDFKVSLPLSNRPNIEFIGELSGSSQPLLAAQVEQAPVGDVTFTLLLNRAELAAMLRREPRVTLPLEIRVVGADDNGFTGELVALTLDVTIKAPVIFPEIEQIPTLDLLRPYSPTTYVPYGAGNELMGQKYYRATIGNGSNSTFVLATGLNSELVYVFGRENVSGGRQLVAGTDFTVTIDNDNQVTIVALTGAPATNAWEIAVLSALTVAQWAADLTVTVPQVIAGGGYPSLALFMDDLGDRVAVLEALLPSISGLVTGAVKGTLEIELPTTSEVLFFRGDGADKLFGAYGLDLTKLSVRAPYLLPAIHDATVDDVTAVPGSPSGNAGKVYRNNAAPDLLVAPGGRVRSATAVRQNEFFGCDGRGFYKVSRDAATNSYYAAAFERELWMLFINDLQLRVGKVFEVQFGVQALTAHSISRAQWALRIERGTAPQDTTPSPVGLNLLNIVWEAAPMLEQRIILTPLATSHFFGVRIARGPGGFTSDKMSYGTWEGNNAAAPPTANFALRARLINFDTENSIPAATGHIAYRILGAMSEAGGEAGKPKAIIR